MTTSAHRRSVLYGPPRRFRLQRKVSSTGRPQLTQAPNLANRAQYHIPAQTTPFAAVVLRMYERRKPIIAAVNGPAAGIGATMILAADLRIVSVAAEFGEVSPGAQWWRARFLRRVLGTQTATKAP
ncbi:enoyl-CoA hydratase-related protein [Nocardia gipuzkoensis]|nr:enoyl-CoA hydratase-related protein [Nocardia gipuzkoensis]MDE1673422.1 enoyl-CoA hydratase-related protein [Nocardia gipuzkoensis]